MSANTDSIRAAYWFDLGQRDALQGRESLAAVLMAVGDDAAAQAYLNGWRAAMQQMTA